MKNKEITFDKEDCFAGKPFFTKVIKKWKFYSMQSEIKWVWSQNILRDFKWKQFCYLKLKSKFFLWYISSLWRKAFFDLGHQKEICEDVTVCKVQSSSCYLRKASYIPSNLRTNGAPAIRGHGRFWVIAWNHRKYFWREMMKIGKILNTAMITFTSKCWME